MESYTLGLYEKAMPNTLSMREKLQSAKRANYDYLELSIDASEEKIQRIYMPKEERFALVQTMYEEGISIDSMCVSALTKYALGDLNEENSQRGMEILRGSIELAADLGVRIIMIPGYDVYYGTPNQETRAKYIEALRKAADMAGARGVVLAFETMENDFMNTVEKAMEYVEIINSPYLQIYPDCGNVTNAMVAYGADFTADMKTGDGHVVAMHLKETAPGIFREMVYGTGHVDFPCVIDAAWNVGVRKFVTEFWYVGNTEWFNDLVETNRMMRQLLDQK